MRLTRCYVLVFVVLMSCNQLNPHPFRDGTKRRHSENWDCAIQDTAKKSVRSSARELTIRKMLADHQLKNHYEVNDSLYEELLTILSLVREAYIRGSDTINTIEARPWNTGKNVLLINIEADKVIWDDSWDEGKQMTGDPEMDGFLVAYGFEVDPKPVSGTNDYHTYLLTSNKPFNFTPIHDELEEMDHVIWADYHQALIGGGSDISAEKKGNSWLLTYHYKSGDCPSGCIYSRDFRYRVEPNCSVIFLGVTG